MTKGEFIRLQAQAAVLREIAEDYAGRTIENIIQNLEARIKESEIISMRLLPYRCVKSDGKFGIERGKIYRLRRNDDRYMVHGAKVLHGMVSVSAKGLSEYFERVYETE